jgi:Domain of unknown function (DUF222)
MIRSNMRSTTATEGIAAGLAAAEAAVTDLVETVQAEALRHENHDDLSALLARARRMQARLDFVALAAIREVDVRGSQVLDGALSVGAWARMHTRMTPAEATGAVRTARALGSGELPGTAGALAAGEIDPAHVRAIAAGVAGAPAGAAALIEEEALAVAREADPRSVAAVMKQFAHALDPEGADAAALARFDRRGLTLSPMLDGSVHIRGLADEVTGALLMTAIDAASPLVAGEDRTAAQRRLDALTDICRSYLASPDAPMTGVGHAHLIVTLEAESLVPPGCHPDGTNECGDTGHDAGHDAEGWDGAGNAGPTCPGGSGPGSDSRDAGPGGTLSWVGPVTASTARRIGCDADVTYVVVDKSGRAEVAGREKRFFNAAQKKAMISRDGDRCCIPFCDRPVTWGDGHHLKHWALGGPTTIANGAIPCAAHHPILHEGGWTLHRLPDGSYIIRQRTGRIIGPEPYPPGHNRPPPHQRT